MATNRRNKLPEFLLYKGPQTIQKSDGHYARARREMPAEIDAVFFRELQFIEFKPSIMGERTWLSCTRVVAEVARRRDARSQLVLEHRTAGTLKTCAMCYDDEVPPDDMLACVEHRDEGEGEHTICAECLCGAYSALCHPDDQDTCRRSTTR